MFWGLDTQLLQTEEFRALESDTQTFYIYASMQAENGTLEDFPKMEEYLFMEIDAPIEKLEILGLIKVNWEWDSIEIVKYPKIAWEN